MHQALNACTFLQCCLAEVYLGHSAIAQQLEKAINGLFVPGPGKNSPSQISLSALENLSGRSASIEQNCLQIEPPLPICPLFQIFKESAKETTDFEDFICSLVISQRNHLVVSHYFSISLQQGVTALSTQKFAFLTQEGKGACTHADYVLASSCSSYFYPSGLLHPGQVFSHHSHILSATPPQAHRDITSVNRGTPARRANHQLLTICVSSQTAQPGSLALPADRMSCPGQDQEQRNFPSASPPPVSRILPPLHRVLFSAFSSFSISPP